jgi:DNA-binding LacI/PurR family transcriptional regulator
MSDVARTAGVSLKTVSNVLNGYRYLRPETKARVEAAIAALGYQVNVTARNLAQGRTRLIKLAIPELRNPYFAELADSIVHEAFARGLTVLLEAYHYDHNAEHRVLRGDTRSLVDGVVFSPVNVGQTESALFNVNFPLVVLGETIFGAPCDHVTMRNIEGARAQVEHLVQLGRRKIAIIGYNDTRVSSASLRYKGAMTALAAAGLPVDPELVEGPGVWLRSTGALLMGQILDRRKGVDAVVCFNDALALGAIHELGNRGVRVPDDVAVIGFDNVEDTEFARPTLSSIDPGREQIARTAIQMLCERMGLVDGFDPAGPPREVFADFRLVPRESTLGRA